MTDIDADVAIVGYGPVGATLAVLLAQSGRTVVVLERWPSPYPLPRAVHFDHEVARIFQSCGLGAQLPLLSEPAPIYEWRNAAGTTLLRIGRTGVAASGWPESSMFHQPAVEAALDLRAGQLPGLTVRRGMEITGVQHAEDVVVLRGTGEVTVTARYAVGCDGANSTVRDAVGLPVEDLGFVYDWLIVDVVLDAPRVFDPINLQICDPARPTTAVSGGPGRRRWEFMRLPHEQRRELDDEERAWELLAPWDVNPGNARLERHAVYTFAASHATQWRAGRVLLAGDAAHLMPPFAGQGMCAGVRDAANLAWKLDLVLGGAAPASLLDTYQAERMASVRQAIEFSVELGRVICIADPAEADARDAAMAAAVGPAPVEVPTIPPIEVGLVHDSAPYAGHLFPQGVVGGRRFDDVHGAGWRLVTTDPGVTIDDSGAAAWFDSIGGKVVVIDEPDETYDQWFAAHAATVAVHRPDFHLYGTASTATGATRLIRDLRTHLASGAVRQAVSSRVG